MKYIKIYENQKLEKEIMDFLNEITDISLDCPFANELIIIHQKDYVDDLYWNVDSPLATLGEFRETYSRMVKDAEKKIIEYLIEDPSLYFWVQEYENYIDIPDWIKQASKYNL